MKSFLKRIIVFLLQWEARLVLKRYKPRIIAVTGSVGKTSTKDAIYSVLAPSFHVRKSEKSFNSEIGVPLTILGLTNAWNDPFRWAVNLIEGLGLIVLKTAYPCILVLEVGADRPGDIQKLASWLKPDTAVLTRFPNVPVHVEFFDSPEHVIEEKLSLVKVLRKEGTVIVNFDDEKMQKIGPPHNGSIVTYGFGDGADIRASNECVLYENGQPAGMVFRVDYNNSSTPITLHGALGRHHIYPVLAALALGISQGLNIVAMAEALSTHSAPPGRMRILRGIKRTTIIDDTYNSSPTAARAALDALINTTTKGRRIAVLGDMMELGNYSVPQHRAIGKYASECVDVLFAVGIRSRYTAEEAEKANKRLKKKDIYVFDTAEEAGHALQNLIQEGDLILIKGSQSMRMERVVEEIMAEPEKKEKLLVRQDTAWQHR